MHANEFTQEYCCADLAFEMVAQIQQREKNTMPFNINTVGPKDQMPTKPPQCRQHNTTSVSPAKGMRRRIRFRDKHHRSIIASVACKHQ